MRAIALRRRGACSPRRSRAAPALRRRRHGAGDGDGRQDRAAAPRREDGALRDVRPPDLREPHRRARPVRGALRQRRPGCREAAAAGRVGARRGRRGARARPRRLAGGRDDRDRGERARTCRSSPTTASSRAATSPTTSRSTTRRSATLQATAFVDALEANGDDSAGILMVNGSPTDNNATLFARGAHERDRRHRPAHPRRVRDAGLEPRQGAGVGGRPDLAVRRRDRRRLRRERRHRERRDRGAPGGERRAAADRHGPGCRALGDPAHPHRRPVHDGLQGDQAAGGARRRGRRRAAQGRGGHRAARRSRARPRRSSIRSRSPSTTSSRPWSPTGSGRSTTSARPPTKQACAAAGLRKG